jgi:hypothetical protein
MDNGIILISVVTAAVVAAVSIWLILHNRMTPEDYALLLATVAAIRSAAGYVLDEATIRTLAGYAWDTVGGNLSRYYTKDQFVDLVLRALRLEPMPAASIATRQTRAAKAVRAETAER